MTSGFVLNEVRRFFARQMAAASGSNDPRLERVFEMVPREAFLPPGPWQVMVNRGYVETPSADPVHLYANNLVALDAGKGINNGEPFLHAAWIGAVAPEGGETVCHVGAGAGYYTAILSVLVLPDGHVHAFEIEPDLAEAARRNLEPFGNVAVTGGDAASRPLPACDLLYANAGVAMPPASWLRALKGTGSRAIFPWRPSPEIGLAMLSTRTERGFALRPLMPAWFIPCIGASGANDIRRIPNRDEARSARSAWLSVDRRPDETAVAVADDLWFSREAIEDPAHSRPTGRTPEG